MPKIIRATRRNAFRSQRLLTRAENLPHVWKTDAVVRPAYPLYVKLNRRADLPHATSYAHAREIATERGFRS